MEELLKRLTETWGPSGREARVRALLQEVLAGRVDEMRVDALGNLICVKRPKGAARGRRVMFAAHMDEIGVIVTDIDERGFLRIGMVGGVSPQIAVGQRVLFENGLVGSVSHEPAPGVDFSRGESNELQFHKLWVDVGARSREEAEKLVGYGAMAVFHRPLEANEHVFIGKALDDRAGCAVLAQALLEMDEVGNEVYAVFTVQEEVGLRGARTSAYGVDPQIGFAIDVTGTGDTPKARPMAVKLGGGAAVKAMDMSLVTPPEIRDLMVERAERRGIPYQIEVLAMGGTDAGAIHLTRAGVPSGCISIPTRYLHTPAEMVSKDDMRACVDLVKALAEEPIAL
ncbi:MAG: M42 family metallopeptidase [Firmicutes bacterium]|nr:M42 family metallopeptidase [Bacillota bacterium]